MKQIQHIAVPDEALISDYATRRGHYVDCFQTSTDQDVNLASYISAFFQTPLFRVERGILGLMAKAPSTAEDIARLAAGTGDRMALWRVEARRDDEILLAINPGRIRTWLRAAPGPDGGTVLAFGSVVIPAQVDAQGNARMGPLFRGLKGFHLAYSRALLWSARRRVRRECAASGQPSGAPPKK